jgi:hypothetical protein
VQGNGFSPRSPFEVAPIASATREIALGQAIKTNSADRSDYAEIIEALERNRDELDRLGAAIAAAQLEAAIHALRNDQSGSISA